MMRIYQEKEPDRSLDGRSSEKKKAPRRSTDALTSAGYDLFEALRKLRLEIAREESLPPYIIFNDKTLIDMCIKLPKTAEDLVKVSLADSQHHRSLFRKLGIPLRKAAGLFGASRGVVLGVEIQDHLLPRVIRQFVHLPVLIRQLEIRQVKAAEDPEKMLNEV